MDAVVLPLKAAAITYCCSTWASGAMGLLGHVHRHAPTSLQRLYARYGVQESEEEAAPQHAAAALTPAP